MEISYLLGGVDLEPVLKLVYATSIAVIIVGFYKHSHSGISYSASFSFTIITCGLLSCAIILIVGENVARAFALVGALAIIRFRTVIKDPKDLTFIFAVLTLGMGIGSGLYFLSISAGFIFVTLTVLMKNSRVFALKDFDGILRVSMNSVPGNI